MEAALPGLETPSPDPGVVHTTPDALEGASRLPVPRSNSSPNLTGIYTDDQPRRSPKGKSTVRNNRFTLDWAYADDCIRAMQACCREGMLYTHEACNARIYVPWHCDERSCSTCSPRRIRRFRRRYEATVRTMARPALVTFTVPNANSPEELPGRLESLLKGFEKLRRSVAWPQCEVHDTCSERRKDGEDMEAWRKARRARYQECNPRVMGFRSLEITYKPSTGYHPHLHALADFPWLENWDKQMGAIVDTWRGLTGARHHVDLTRPKSAYDREGLIREAIKYTCKQWELEDSSLRAILAVIGKRKMFNAFGGLEMVEIPDEASGALCPQCHEKPFSIIRRKLSEEEVSDLQGSPTWPEVYTGWFFKDRELDPAAEPIGFSEEFAAVA
jgi:hypothetical protein